MGMGIGIRIDTHVGIGPRFRLGKRLGMTGLPSSAGFFLALPARR